VNKTTCFALIRFSLHRSIISGAAKNFIFRQQNHACSRMPGDPPFLVEWRTTSAFDTEIPDEPVIRKLELPVDLRSHTVTGHAAGADQATILCAVKSLLFLQIVCEAGPDAA
jgi:hypothetical protein